MAKRIVVIGGVAGGASAAARLRRLDETAQITVLEQGEHISFANCALPYYIGDVISDQQDLLLQSPMGMQRRYAIDVKVRHRAQRINRQQKTVTVRNLNTDEVFDLPYDALVLSPGAEPVRPNLPGLDLPHVYTLRSLQDALYIRNIVDTLKPKAALVVGGGFIGVEMADNLLQRGVQVHLAELTDQLLPPLDKEMAAIMAQAARKKGASLHLAKGLSSLTQAEDGMTAALSDGTQLGVQLVIMSVGVKPDVALAREAGLTIGPRGGIAVNETLQTSDDSIYAVGDAIEVVDFVSHQSALIPLAGPANRQGRMAGELIAGREAQFAPVQGTSIVAGFGLTAASVGANEKRLKAQGIAYDKVYVHPPSHASYYPGAATLSLKLLFSLPDGKILGAQAIGRDGVDKRIDVIATAQRMGATVKDLSQLELCYAPPFSSAKDPVNVAGFAAMAVLAGDIKQTHWDQLAQALQQGALLVDVRTVAERARGAIEGSIHLPVDELRQRIEELPKDKKLVLHCQSGLRSYVAARMLAQLGYEVSHISGGYLTYSHAMAGK